MNLRLNPDAGFDEYDEGETDTQRDEKREALEINSDFMTTGDRDVVDVLEDARIAGTMPREEIMDYKFLFDMFDNDKSGSIHVKDVQSLMKNMGALSLTESETLDLINQDDLNGDGQIEFVEFVILIEALKNN